MKLSCRPARNAISKWRKFHFWGAKTFFWRNAQDLCPSSSRCYVNMGCHDRCIPTRLSTFRVHRCRTTFSKSRLSEFHIEFRRKTSQYPTLVSFPLEMAEPDTYLAVSIIPLPQILLIKIYTSGNRSRLNNKTNLEVRMKSRLKKLLSFSYIKKNSYICNVLFPSSPYSKKTDEKGIR